MSDHPEVPVPRRKVDRLDPDRLRPVTAQTLEWARTAPVVVRASTTTTAAPAAIFAVLADHERFPEWFPGVRAARPSGRTDGVGARRTVEIPGAIVDEEFIEWTPGKRWAFTAVAASPRFFTSLVEECVIEEGSPTVVHYNVHVKPRLGLGTLVRLLCPLQRANTQRALRQLAARAEAADSSPADGHGTERAPSGDRIESGSHRTPAAPSPDVAVAIDSTVGPDPQN